MKKTLDKNRIVEGILLEITFVTHSTVMAAGTENELETGKWRNVDSGR